MPVPSCQACGAAGTFVPHFPEVAIERCTRCGLLTADVGALDVAKLYDEGYFKGGEYRDYEEDAHALGSNFRRVLGVVRRMSEGTRLLELGAAYGFFQEQARTRFPECMGIEISDAAASAARARGLDVVTGDVLAMEMPAAGPFDVICLWDTIEHLERPGDVVLRLASWLRPGGILALTTGDAGSLVARFRGRRWRLVHPPTHVHYFDRGSLDTLARRAGLEPAHWSHPGSTRSYASMAFNVFAVRGAWGRAVHKVLTLGGTVDFPVYLNLFDLCLHVARKPGAAGADVPRAADVRTATAAAR